MHVYTVALGLGTAALQDFLPPEFEVFNVVPEA